MLVLSRKLGQEVVIDGEVRIRVLELRGNQVRLGVTAPQDVEILRGELAVAVTTEPTRRRLPDPHG